MVQTAHSRPPRVLSVIRNPKPGEVGVPIDWSGWYLDTEDDVGQSPEQDQVVDAFTSALKQLAAERNWGHVFVARDAFFAWIQDEPRVRISPDVYTLEPAPIAPFPGMWQTWLPGHRPPRFALEVVSDDWKKDYEDAPAKYAMLGAEELVIHDPEASRGVTGSTRLPRVPLQVYRREADGSFACTHRGAGPARVATLDAWLVCRPDAGIGWLRIARDALGQSIVATEGERAARLAARLRALGLDPEE